MTNVKNLDGVKRFVTSKNPMLNQMTGELALLRGGGGKETHNCTRRAGDDKPQLGTLGLLRRAASNRQKCTQLHAKLLHPLMKFILCCV